MPSRRLKLPELFVGKKGEGLSSAWRPLLFTRRENARNGHLRYGKRRETRTRHTGKRIAAKKPRFIDRALRDPKNSLHHYFRTVASRRGVHARSNRSCNRSPTTRFGERASRARTHSRNRRRVSRAIRRRADVRRRFGARESTSRSKQRVRRHVRFSHALVFFLG